MSATFRGARCAVCKERTTRITGWLLHYRAPRVLGGSHCVESRALLHPECHDRVHRQHLSVLGTASPRQSVRKGLSCMAGNCHVRF